MPEWTSKPYARETCSCGAEWVGPPDQDPSAFRRAHEGCRVSTPDTGEDAKRDRLIRAVANRNVGVDHSTIEQIVRTYVSVSQGREPEEDVELREAGREVMEARERGEVQVTLKREEVEALEIASRQVIANQGCDPFALDRGRAALRSALEEVSDEA